jgi:hypothetical protein
MEVVLTVVAVFFGCLHRVVIKCSDVSEERAASVLRVTELVPVNVQVMAWKKTCPLM